MKKSILALSVCAALRSANAAVPVQIEYGQAAGESLQSDTWAPDGPGPFPAVILAHGTPDDRVALSQLGTMQARLRAVGVLVEVITIEGGAPGMASWDRVAPDFPERVVAWLARTLAPASP